MESGHTLISTIPIRLCENHRHAGVAEPCSPRREINMRFPKLMALIILLTIRPVVFADPSDQVYDRIIENLRWSRYWFGVAGIGDVYVEGKKISALIFWAKKTDRQIMGLCSTDFLSALHTMAHIWTLLKGKCKLLRTIQSGRHLLHLLGAAFGNLPRSSRSGY